ncbi:MAG: dihydrolipoamide acetyltransferase family protein [Actinomycetota bacterium]
MGRLTIKVPDVGEGIAEVELVSWSVAEGQEVLRNQIIAEVMTDKATVEVPAPVDGVVGALNGGVGEILLVGSPLFTLQVEGDGDETVDAEVADGTGVGGTTTGGPAPGSTASPTAEPANAAVIEAALERQAQPAAPSGPATSTTTPRPINAGPRPAPRPEGRRPTATPAVRRRARDAGIDLRTVAGTGPAGRITHEDLDAVFTSGSTGAGHARAVSGGAGIRAADERVDDQPIVGVRRRIARQMVSSMSTIPHITYVEEVDMTALEDLRATLNENRTEGQPKLTLLPFLVRALVNRLPDFPQMNAHVIDQEVGDGSNSGGAAGPSGTDTLRLFGGVHVGIAAQTDAGLVVPVLRHAETHTIWSAAAEIGALADAARTGTAGPQDLTGSTITISSLGSLGGLVSTPVINKPETTIIGVNKMTTAPVWVDGAFVPRKMMNLSSSFDHRVIDGWDAANFVQAVKRSLEQPALLFVDQP